MRTVASGWFTFTRTLAVSPGAYSFLSSTSSRSLKRIPWPSSFSPRTVNTTAPSALLPFASVIVDRDPVLPALRGLEGQLPLPAAVGLLVPCLHDLFGHLAIRIDRDPVEGRRCRTPSPGARPASSPRNDSVTGSPGRA